VATPGNRHAKSEQKTHAATWSAQSPTVALLRRVAELDGNRLWDLPLADPSMRERPQ